MIRKVLKYVGLSLLILIGVDIALWQVLDRTNLPKEAEGLSRGIQDTQTQWMMSYVFQPITDTTAQRIIYVHGTPGDATSLQGYLIDPIKGFDSISIDRPGFGHTTPPTVALTLEEQAQVIEPFLVEREGKWPILVGHSMGGPIIAAVAGLYPEQVGGLVILAGSLDPELEEWKWYNRLVDTKLTAYMIPRSLRSSNRELYPLKEELEKLKPLLGQVTCPVVIVHAPDDMLVPFANVAYMEEHFPAGTVVETIVLDGKNHFLPWNSEEEVRKAVLTAAAGIRVGDGAEEANPLN